VRIASLTLFGMLLASTPLTSAVSAQEAAPGHVDASIDCQGAALAFEQSAKLPAGLLLAIGQVESGRADPVTGRVSPWPWATNHAGQGHYFSSVQEAIAWVTAEQALGNRSIDVGCFQVNLQYHPDAFSSLAEAFDPTGNARYAASLLNQLRQQSGSWPAAIALYHSADPIEGGRYAARVLATLDGGGRTVGIPPVAGVWFVDPVVVRIAAAAAGVRVETPSWASGRPGAAPPAQRNGLPRVFTPSP
jgi:hypothetical protein